MDPGGRSFDEADEGGDLQDSRRNLYDPQNTDETGGMFGKPIPSNIIKNEWNAYYD